MIRPDKRLLALVGLALVVGLLWWAKSGGPSTEDPQPVATPTAQASSAFEVAYVDLPIDARLVIAEIEAGGPYAYAKDGSIFGNREQLLPLHERGYYREYTVPTPGSEDRGARRIILGGAGELYYTDDHYLTFRRIGAKP